MNYPSLRLRLMGSPRIELDGEILQIASNKARALLYYLAVEQKVYSREHLLELLWPYSKIGSARSSLRNQLTELRKQLSPYLDINRETIQFVRLANTAIDIDLLKTTQDPNTEINTVRAAIRQWEGEFLAGFSIKNAPLFEQWVLYQQATQSTRICRLLERLILSDLTDGTIELAIDNARRFSEDYPFDDKPNFLLLLSLGIGGHYSDALAHYNRWQNLLWQELEVAPPEYIDKELIPAIQHAERDLIESIAQSTFNGYYFESGSENLENRVQLTLPAQGELRSPNETHDHLRPIQSQHRESSFIGRIKESELLRTYLGGETEYRLITVCGPCGVGKSALVQHAFEEIASVNSQYGGVAFKTYFVWLNDESSINDTLDKIFLEIGQPLADTTISEESLFEFLNSHSCLLVLDGYSTSSAHVNFLQRILTQTSSVKVLVTSRSAHGLENEQVLHLTGLATSIPTNVSHGQASVTALHSEAVTCFLGYASQAKGEHNNEEAAVRICQLVSGVPLALKLVANWTELHSLEGIVEVLEKEQGNLHRFTYPTNLDENSLEAIIQYSWELLHEELQTNIASLSIFDDQFSSDEVQKIFGLPESLLGQLVGLSWLQLLPNGKFRFHSALRGYAKTKLAGTDSYKKVCEHYIDYYLNFALRSVEQLRVTKHSADTHIATRCSSIKSAWFYALELKDYDSLVATLEFVWRFCDRAGRFSVAHQLLEQTLIRINSFLSDNDTAMSQQKRDCLLNILESGREWFASRLGIFEPKPLMLDRINQLCNQANYHNREIKPYLNEMGLVLAKWSLLLASRGETALAKEACENSQLIFAQLGDNYGKLEARYGLGYIAFVIGDYRESNNYLDAAIGGCNEVHYPDIAVKSQILMARIALLRGQIMQAHHLLRLSITASKKVGDRTLLAECHFWTAHLENHLGNYPSALNYLKECQGYLQHNGHGIGHMSMLLELGTTYRLLGDFNKSEEFLLNRLELVQKAESVIAPVYKELGATYFMAGSLNQAEYYYRNALELFRQGHDVPELAFTMLALSHTLLDLSDRNLVEVQALLAEALSIANRHDLQPISMAALVTVARIAVRYDHDEHAAALLRVALESPASSKLVRVSAQRHLNDLLSAGSAVQDISTDFLGTEWHSTAQYILDLAAGKPFQEL